MEQMTAEPKIEYPDIVVDTEPVKKPEIFELITAEQALVVEPLLAFPWFDDKNPMKITKRLLGTVPGVTQEILDRYLESARQYRRHKKRDLFINERMSPLRANLFSSILTPALHVFGDKNPNEKYNQHAVEMFGDNFPEIRSVTKGMSEDIAYKKSIGKQIDIIQKKIDEEIESTKPNENKIAELKEIMRQVEIDSPITIDEVKRAFTLAKLISIVVRDSEGFEPKYGNADELIIKLTDGYTPLEKIDYSAMQKAVEEKYRDGIATLR